MGFAQTDWMGETLPEKFDWSNVRNFWDSQANPKQQWGVKEYMQVKY